MSDSEPPPLFGAVFGLTEDIDTGPDSKFPARSPPRRAVAQDDLIESARVRKSLQDRNGAGIRRRRREKPQRGLPKELQVTALNLKSFDAVHHLLASFQDPFAAGCELEKHIRELPILAGRLLRTARILTGRREINDVGAALSLLGNKALEMELLNFLEDLTLVKSKSEEDALNKLQK